MKTKKSLGQHFLVDQKAIDGIVDLVAEDSSSILEIGPGGGALTERLAKKTQNFFLVEKDEKLLESILEKLNQAGTPPKASWAQDMLEFPLENLFQMSTSGSSLTVVSNLPYNVATEILFRLLKYSEQIPMMVLMFQKEVGERILAKPSTKAYGTITIPVQNLYKVEKVQVLKPGSFRPAPKVDSIILKFSRREKPLLDFDKLMREKFQDFVRMAFSYRRKTLENTLKITGNNDILQGQSILSEAGIDGRRRAETLTIEEFGCLFQVAMSRKKLSRGIQ